MIKLGGLPNDPRQGAYGTAQPGVGA